ncbi:phosphoribosylformylglycinamidine synthase subunit PurQ [bacterium]|nr:phosphoribosylformylglycinamidine synthase subunit PurQ [bacterium]
MKVGVITFPGSNCDDDCVYALQGTGLFQVSSLWHKSTESLGDLAAVVLPGGFSYGDYLRTGAMAAVSPIMDQVKAFAAAGGKVLGICNGFQILCEAGLLPGALVRNEKLNFICRDVTLEVSGSNPWTSSLTQGSRIQLPIAHGEGRYVTDPTTYSEMLKHNQIVFRYTEAVNGSYENIAGITNQEKNVCGMMPHPERATDLKTRDGLKIWQALSEQLKGVS